MVVQQKFEAIVRFLRSSAGTSNIREQLSGFPDDLESSSVEKAYELFVHGLPELFDHLSYAQLSVPGGFIYCISESPRSAEYHERSRAKLNTLIDSGNVTIGPGCILDERALNAMADAITRNDAVKVHLGKNVIVCQFPETRGCRLTLDIGDYSSLQYMAIHGGSTQTDIKLSIGRYSTVNFDRVYPGNYDIRIGDNSRVVVSALHHLGALDSTLKARVGNHSDVRAEYMRCDFSIGNHSYLDSYVAYRAPGSFQIGNWAVVYLGYTYEGSCKLVVKDRAKFMTHRPIASNVTSVTIAEGSSLFAYEQHPQGFMHARSIEVPFRERSCVAYVL